MREIDFCNSSSWSTINFNCRALHCANGRHASPVDKVLTVAATGFCNDLVANACIDRGCLRSKHIHRLHSRCIYAIKRTKRHVHGRGSCRPWMNAPRTYTQTRTRGSSAEYKHAYSREVVHHSVVAAAHPRTRACNQHDCTVPRANAENLARHMHSSQLRAEESSHLCRINVLRV